MSSHQQHLHQHHSGSRNTSSGVGSGGGATSAGGGGGGDFSHHHHHSGSHHRMSGHNKRPNRPDVTKIGLLNTSDEPPSKTARRGCAGPGGGTAEGAAPHGSCKLLPLPLINLFLRHFRNIDTSMRQ